MFLDLYVNIESDYKFEEILSFLKESKERDNSFKLKDSEKDGKEKG